MRGTSQVDPSVIGFCWAFGLCRACRESCAGVSCRFRRRQQRFEIEQLLNWRRSGRSRARNALIVKAKLLLVVLFADTTSADQELRATGTR